MSWKDIEAKGGVAVITGGARGVGFAAAEFLATRGFSLLLADMNADALADASQKISATGAQVATAVTDVSDAKDVAALADKAFAMGEVAVLMNNAGVGISSSTWDNPEAWRKTFDVNFFGIVNGVQAFVPHMIAAGRPACVINTGSKQGITTPPGNPAYNASKAAVKVLTEQLSHELREANAPIDAHLFVPGFTYTGMIAAHFSEKPGGAWTSAECVEYLFDNVADGVFYVLCPDNMVTEEVDAKRVLWSAQDIAQRRPALSRWHPDWKDKFAAYENE